uniref:Opine dehydrogenase domain-containing protein n=1 Tax=Chromera velia CCMP2878 TaxID=1169474 RepID=A0A0G4I670_9ALVE|mmetsp:Transcript_2268/g.4772  ORF Transcript_2268/g.4772 Transcript_2268/m.4772 type:complete len:460 (+) Transcript_2268:133-1512(+)|eukprot:Cvel_1878.t1-p1 / transcript=Cvel_1878.t1 / gene=Cvel_1878 / organism=Chromera_velia_CCMP2878 / gene_product=Octopine dehydrogenase, putative / transcript_product=Octopine dehydrogenase, putative / location=Cvel_scaffold70:24370-26543(-) / protein_length=459 / sequence_SO=supercontig / SO=protein_coding / is_pseudo=false
MSRTAVICGSGNAAHLLVALLGSQGWTVISFVRDPNKLGTALRGNGDGQIRALHKGREIARGRPHLVTSNPEDVREADLVLLSLPGFAHRPILEQLAPFLKDGVLVGGLPANGNFDLLCGELFRTGYGDGEDANVHPSMKETGAIGHGRVTVFGLCNLPWVCRTVELGSRVELMGFKGAVDCAAVPASETDRVCALLSSLFAPVMISPVRSFLSITLAPNNQVLHPACVYGVFGGWAETDFEKGVETAPLLYSSRNTVGLQAELLEHLASEVKTVTRNLELRVPGLDLTGQRGMFETMKRYYAHACPDSSSLSRLLATNPSYTPLKVPMVDKEKKKGGMKEGHGRRLVPDFESRYFTEDVPLGLCVVKGFALFVDVHTPLLDRIVRWAQERMPGSPNFIDVSGKPGPDFLTHTASPQSFGLSSLEAWAARVHLQGGLCLGEISLTDCLEGLAGNVPTPA